MRLSMAWVLASLAARPDAELVLGRDRELAPDLSAGVGLDVASAAPTFSPYPDLWDLDLRLGKRSSLGGTSLLLEASVFSPRIVRLGARPTF